MAAGLSAGTISLIGAGANLLGGFMGSQGAGAAADAQLAAAREAAQTQRYMYDTTRADQAPYRDIGYAALDQLRARMGLSIPNPSSLPATGAQPAAGAAPWTGNASLSAQQLMQEDPSYQFRLAEGEKGISRAAAAGTGQLSGATMKALARYNQDYAANEFNNSWNRLSSLAGIGQSATNQTGAAGNAFASNLSNLQTQMGNARAAGYVGRANAWSRGIGGALGAMQDQSMLNALQSQPSWAGGFNPLAAGYGDSSRFAGLGSQALANGGWGIE